MLYLFVSDLALSTLIFAFGMSGFFTLVNFAVPNSENFETSVAIIEDCEDGCQFLGSKFFDGERFQSLWFYMRFPEELSEVEALYELDDFVTSAKLVSVKDGQLAQSEREHLEESKDVTHFLRLKLNVETYQVSSWDTFTFLLKKQIDEIWRHFRFNFQYYSFQQYKYGKYDLREARIFSIVEEFSRSDALGRVVTNQEDRRKVASILMDGKLPDDADPDAPASAEMISMLHLARFQWAKWHMLRTLGSLDFSRDYDNSDFRRFMRDPGAVIYFGDKAVRPHFLPMTTLWLSSISFSSMFLFFVLVKLALLFLQRSSGVFYKAIERYPLTVVVLLVLPILSLV